MSLPMATQQTHWYYVAGSYVVGQTVVDVGAGTGYGVLILKGLGAEFVMGIDPNPHLPYVFEGRGEDLPVDFCDWITCIDVIEHVEEDIRLLQRMLKVARVGVFLTTPNYDVYHCENEAHIREYTPFELEQLLYGLDYDIWNYSHSLFPPERVEYLNQCQNFGIVIWVHGRPEDA